MNKRDEIISMARRAGVIEPLGHTDPWVWGEDALERFADMVAARAVSMIAQPIVVNDVDTTAIVALAVRAEREACAAVCFQQIARWTDDRARYAAGECSAAIRSRGTP